MYRYSFIIVFFSCFISSVCSASASCNDIRKNNCFEGQVEVVWLDDPEGRNMKLLNSVSYIDSNNVEWTAPKEHLIDGASIPKIFWSHIGSPYVGKYRKASVIHDYYCDMKNRPYKDVHKMFYDASIAAGTSESKAKIMWAAISIGGPRWTIIRDKATNSIEEIIILDPKNISDADFDEMKRWINENNPSLENIEVMIDKLSQ